MMNNHAKSKDKSAIFLNTVARTVTTGQMIRRGESLLVGVSGGVDSVVLLAVMRELAEKLGIGRLGVAHLNHGLRGENADRDEAFVSALAKKWGPTFYMDCADVAGFAEQHRLSIEDAARRLRYEFLHDTADKEVYDKIATGHHADDNAEQVLMNLLRGSGPAGLAGIPPIREDIIIRPLIKVFRKEILAFAADRNLTFQEDETNTDIRFLRNQVRHQLLPLLAKEYNPEISRNLNQVAEIFSAEEVWHHELVDELFDQACLEMTGKLIVLSTFIIMTLPVAAQRRLIRKAIKSAKNDLRRITFEHIESIRNCLKDNDYFSLNLPDGITIVRKQGELRFLSDSVKKTAALDRRNDFCYTLLEQGPQNKTLEVEEINGRFDFIVLNKEDLPDITSSNENTAFFDADKLTYPLTVRNIFPGDRFSPLGLSGTQKVKDFFINTKVPRPQRARCPVLVSGDEIIWLVGYRTSEIGKITEETQNILKAELAITEERPCPP